MSLSIIPYLTEALAVADVNKTKGEKPAVYFHGRFQPLTLAHAKIINDMIAQNPGSKTGHFVFIVKGQNTSEDKEKNPFDFKTQKRIIQKSCPMIGDNIIEVSDAFLGTFVDVLRNRGYEPEKFYCGTDRVKSYEDQIKRYKEKLDIDIDIVEIKRTDADISATKLRQAIKDNDFTKFKSMTLNLGEKEFNLLKAAI